MAYFAIAFIFYPKNERRREKLYKERQLIIYKEVAFLY